MRDKKKLQVLVLGIGNEILQDEGLGIHAARMLEKMNLPEEVEVIAGGTAGLALLPLLKEKDYLIVIDAVNARTEPGAIFKFKPDQVDVYPLEYQLSFHQLGLYDVLRVAQLLGDCPDTTIFGMQPGTISWGMELTPPIADNLPRLVELVVEEINKILGKGPH
ncbi:HyaD/HybD family hydrogenase maturation endopeptidase [Carboxydocella sp. JDF658]|uniref:HyaD/HybD family hydrogenase maturation endopeptidase n=1 Tax=Carboxydocella sp. JDF658 TaxID=1926600 RepID=UPI0009AE50DF|nr:HyaD/HybD family hydrogenase maturation endopeptidase [Carboxydocella sp. JDF658]GAW32807.1 hydrogenase maturation protease [Carboxydocella sp. JDF658]